MNFLVIDTSRNEGFVLLLSRGRVARASLGERNQSKTLLPSIINLLRENDLDLKELSFIGVCIGPGSFTGTRIGVITAKSLAYGTNLPILPFTSALIEEEIPSFLAESFKSSPLLSPLEIETLYATTPGSKII